MTTRTTKVGGATKTIYRKCSCGETAHDAEADRVNGEWVTVYKCRNCRSPIVSTKRRAY